jgi:phosphatidate cytidylyltransferase
MLKTRVITALWGIPLLLLAVWFDKPLPWFLIFAGIWGVLAAFEFYRITGVSKSIPLTCFGIIWVLLFLLRTRFPDELELPLLLTSGAGLSLIMLIFLKKREGLFLSWAWMLGGILYTGWLLSYLPALRLEAGRDWLLLALVATFGSDTAAYFIGKALGKHKLAPSISPGKTWEGAVAGLFGAVIISLLFTLNTPVQIALGYGQAVILGLIISVSGQLGDLVESLLKRNTGVKDSGKLMPGHGGLLDRMDSVVFAGVAVYLYYIYVFL